MKLQEEILRIREVMLLTEQDTYCEKELFRKMNSPASTKIFRNSIEKMLDPYKQEWNGDRKKYEEILTLIGKTPYQIKNILDVKFIYDKDGNWRRINKLNTNYSDIAIFVIDILKNEQKNLCEILERIKNDDYSDLEELSLSILNNSEEYYNKYLSDDDEKYTVNSKTNTEYGDAMEKSVIDLFREKYGWELIYQSVEGSPIDTKLGIDIIMRTRKRNIAKIQIKGVGDIYEVTETDCEKKMKSFNNKKKRGGYFVNAKNGVRINPYNINFVAYANKDGKILVVQKYIPIRRINNKCIDQESNEFPSNPSKPFYVDHESVFLFKN